MPQRIRRTALALLLLSLLFRLVFIADGMQDLVRRGPLYDDSFYSFGIARNIALGFGSTFDGEHPTNGYQPLWVAILVPLYALTGAHPTIPIYAALVLSAVLNVLTGWVVFRLLRRFVSTAAAFLGLVLWGFGPAIVRQSVNGLETSLAMLLVACALEYYVRVFRPRRAAGRRVALTLGALLGLAVLARVDALLFVVALAADALVRRLDVRALRLAAATCAAVVLPWCIVSQLTVGAMVPESGKATRFLSATYAPNDIPALSDAGGEASAGLVWQNVLRSGQLVGTWPALHVFTRSLERVLDRSNPQMRKAPAIGILVLAAVLLCVALGWRASPRVRRLPRALGFLWVYCVLLVVAYSFVVFGHIFFSRYYYPIFFASVLLGGVAFEIVLQRFARARPRRRRALAMVLVGLYAVLLPYMSWNRLRRDNYQFINALEWIETHTPAEARIGIFNAGAIGYFSNRRVVNLDGKVNPRALEALRATRIRRYLVEEEIDFVVDHQWILERFLNDPGEAAVLTLTPVADPDGLSVPGWRALRVAHVGGGTAARSRMRP